MKDQPVLTTKRLLLRRYKDTDVSNMLKIFSDPVAMQFFPATKSRKETEQWISWNTDSYRDNGFGLYAVELIDTHEFIGYCGIILQRDVAGIDEIEVGYGLVRKHWHKGYAVEAAKACKKHGFTFSSSGKVISLVRPENTPSRRVAERNGMKAEKSVIRWDLNHLVYAAYAKNDIS